MIVVLKPIKQNKKNAKKWPEFYCCNFLTPGLVSYADVGAGVAWLSKETILKMLPSFQGKPVILSHIDVTPKDFDNHAVGYITRVWFDDYTNWACCHFILTDDKAKEAIAKGYSVSCAYDQCVTDPAGGEKNAVPYDEEILSGCGNHLALVTNPRYEEARVTPLDCMMLVNSKKAIIKEGEGRRNTVILKNATKAPNHPQEKAVVKPIHRICDSCEYLCSNHCDVAGKGGEITLEYAGKRLLGLAQDCSAYEKKEGGMKENKVTVCMVRNDKYKCQKCGRVFLSTTRTPGNCPDCSSSEVEKVKK